MSEILKSLWAKFYAWALPSAIAIGATGLFLLPQLNILLTDGFQLIKYKEEGFMFIALTSAVAISLSSLSTTLYRILEGYSWPYWLQELGKERQRSLRKELIAAAANKTGWRRGLALEDIARYPVDEDQVVPTKFGNAIRAFETYGKTRFNLDSQTLWHELVAVAPKYIQSEITSAQSSVDFFVASFYLSITYGAACLILGVAEHYKFGILLQSITAFLLAIMCHWLAIRAIDAWSDPVRALVNLGRLKLADNLGLGIPEKLEDEKRMWGILTGYIYYANAKYGELLNDYRITPSIVEKANNNLKGADGDGVEIEE